MSLPPPDNIVLFDSLCNLCNGWSRYVLRRDSASRFTLCRVQSPAGQQLLGKLGLPLDTFETVVLLERSGGSYRDYHKSDAVLRILAQLSGPWRHLAVLRHLPRPVRDLVYDAVARNRYRLFGRRDQCLVPSALERHRFLEEVPEEDTDEPV
ncbi:Predicted thiol-disulfide oxidoreductase YuxK, DCC family [Microbulbifer donghaiensis]|uniref:Predicted thiol-disulfide oxidoreductase YuxK, DCC family n=1 Tax=Microbulbifer donghaiensis TaxID=494016 RepID=A0A1M5GMU7_9GAMM|nr:thiol-disulfide oxidoreductase DCC family protein [Microbulbifer donghaiensis]SHG05016.1 Predicted thiol-disulfide oxidoreductase YuxK, DCC family [Microbulbifer donghaiensis]